ncbi:CCA tRNA nucleotidyltransferase, mitochondrial [Cytospora mali]|uniref:CCA tRNA nucleotidyltransferase, mitochondrial n=1 Tax=Cytospora mali TaxID=578113 RepID=A0A194UTS7_CYTMA|nr:CCA tRNA nucleotidyltransferase, mitochondrial [Valsa mali var. pyri (nom. inval.)]
MKRKLSPDSARMMTTIQLDPLEKQLKGLLLDVAANVDTAEAKKPDEKVVLRWAGGWVRDKLLGRPSHDIDVAINCMTGEVFGEKLRKFCDVPENKEKHSLRPEDIGNLHKIEKNPEKSKNLETATVKLFGLDVDFVNLRTETYTEDSRNPQVEFGTAEEDALRRDATVNALFYNIHTNEVEDFVGGIPDMEAGIIRTPMDPFQTFMDDPLRVLRLVRFASRLSFTIASSTMESMGNARVLEALRAKISRERVGVEVEKMLKGEHPRDAVRLIDQLGLYHTVFTDTTKSEAPQPSLEGWTVVYETLHTLASGPESTSGLVYDVLVTSEEERYYAWVLACIVPFAEFPSPSGGNPKKQLPPATLAAREGIKAPNKLADIITAAVRHLNEISDLKAKVCNGDPSIHERDRFGMAIRGWEARGTHWRLQVLFAMLYEMLEAAKAADGKDPTSAIHEIQSSWKEFLSHLEKLDLMEAPSLKPLVDGRTLLQALGVKKPGKWMSSALDVCMAWQLRHPEETDPAGAIEEVQKRKEELGIAL